MSSEAAGPNTVVIGVGSPLMGDDGIGIRALERLREAYAFEPHVELIDGGTWGMRLLPAIDDADRLLILDAIDAGRPAGSLLRLERHALPAFWSTKLSPHQIDLREVFAVAELRGTLPEATVALGIQPGEVVLSYSLSETAEAALDGLVAHAVGQLESWGHVARPRVPVDA